MGANAEIDRSSLLGRQIAKRCLYGIDMNELAVEPARLAIWVRTFVPGLPMSSLDHQLVHGNSLTGVGTIAETLAALVPRTDTTGDPGFAGMIIEQELEASRRALEDAAALKEATSAESRAAADGYRRAIEAAWPARLLLDAAVAVRLELMSPPAGFDPDEIRGAAGSPDVQGPLSQLNVVHFPERFPEVFLRNRPGFDVLLGNPPWEKAKVETSRWWALRFPGLRSLPQGEQDRRIAALRIARPDLAAEIDAEVAANDALRRLLLRGPYPGMGVGDPDLYQAFAWRIAAVPAREDAQAWSCLAALSVRQAAPCGDGRFSTPLFLKKSPCSSTPAGGYLTWSDIRSL